MVDVSALVAEKKSAVKAGDFERSEALQKQLDEVDIEALVAEKAQAVVDEDYMRAAELKKLVDSLTLERDSPASESPKKTSSPSKSSAGISPTGRTRGKLNEDTGADKKSATSTNNPIKSDSYLCALIDSLEDIQNHKQFKKWRRSFLEKFENFLTEDGTRPAQEAYDNFRNRMASFVKNVATVEKLVEKGDISVERTTVKGRSALSELDKYLSEIIVECSELIPSTSSEEKSRGYSKFNLGAVLVRDGFQEHERLTKCCETLSTLGKSKLADISSPQQIMNFSNFETALQKFQDIMEDLGLFKVMKASFSFSEPSDEFIFVDVKTGAIGTIEIKCCIDKGIVTAIPDGSGKTMTYKESIKDSEDKEEILEMVRETLKV